MKSITLKINLNEAEWEILKERAEKSLPGILEETGEPFSLDDAIENEIRCIVSADLELFDVYDHTRHNPEVRNAINTAIREARNLKN